MGDATQRVLERVSTVTKFVYPTTIPNVAGILAPAPVDPNFMQEVINIKKPLPAWAQGESINVPSECNGVTFYTPHCQAASVYRDVLVADAAKHDSLMYNDPAFQEYADLQKKISLESDPATRASLERKREALYPKFKMLDVFVKGKGVEKVPIANPYVAYAARRLPAVKDFVTKPPLSAIELVDPSGEMIQANIKALQTIALPEMLADKPLSISLLESLWFCGTAAGAGGPRCHPLQVLAELREFNAAQAQKKAQKDLEGRGGMMPMKSFYPLALEIVQWLRNAGVHATISRVPREYIEPEPVAPAPAVAPAAAPAAVPAAVAAPAAPAAAAPRTDIFHIRTGGIIIPRSIGNLNPTYGIPQYIPTRIGAL